MFFAWATTKTIKPFWSISLSLLQFGGDRILLEWTDTLIIATLLLWILWKLAFFSAENKTLAVQKETSVMFCKIAAQGCLIAAAFPLYRIMVWSETPLFLEAFKLTTLLSTIFVLWNSPQFIRKHPTRPLLEYSFFVLTGLAFLLLLVDVDDFITLFLALVGFSLSLYVLIMMFWSESRGSYITTPFPSRTSYQFEPFEQAHEASLKYFYLSAFSSSLILLSSAIFYTMTQTVSFDELQLILARPATTPGFDWLLVWKKLFWLALALYIIGFTFKLSAFPSYFWAPEVYHGAASPVTAFIIMPVKIGVFAIFARTLTNSFELFHDFWGPMLLVFGSGSLIVGALGALTERVLKKFIAYSSINQIGFVLVGLSTGQVTGLQTVIIFFLFYIVTSIALFAVFLNVENQTTGEHMRYVSDLGFLSPHEWLPRVALSIVFFSLAGLPPFAGFFSKFYVLLHLFEEGYLTAVFIGIVTSLISSYYYLTLVTYMWFGSVPQAALKKTWTYLPLFKSKWDSATKTTLVLVLVLLTMFIFVNEAVLNFSQQMAYSCAYFPNGKF